MAGQHRNIFASLAQRRQYKRFLAKRCQEPLCTFVNEIPGLPLALCVFPEVLDFSGDAVLQLVERGLHRKGLRVQRGTGSAPDQR